MVNQLALKYCYRCLNASSSARSCTCMRYGTTIKCTLEQKWACNAFNYDAVWCSLPKLAPTWWLVACIDIFRISIKKLYRILNQQNWDMNDTPTITCLSVGEWPMLQTDTSPFRLNFSVDYQNAIFTCPVLDLIFRHSQACAFLWTTKFLSGKS